MTFLRKLHDCSTIAPEKEIGEERGGCNQVSKSNLNSFAAAPGALEQRPLFKRMKNDGKVSFVSFSLWAGRGSPGQPCNSILTGLNTGIIHHDTLRVLAPASFIMQAHVLCGVALLLLDQRQIRNQSQRGV